MANGLIGLSAELPHEIEIGQNTIVLAGWKMSIERGVKKYALLLEDGRECKPMQANSVLQELSAFELAHQNILFKSADGGYKYLKLVILMFKYTPKGNGTSFKSPYSDIVVKLRQDQTTAPNPAGKTGTLGG